MSIKGGRAFLFTGLLVILIIPASLRISAQNAAASNEVFPPIRVNGVVQPNVVGLVPDKVRHAYGFDQINASDLGSGQTIALIEAFDHPDAESDLATFSQTFNLPPLNCMSPNPCFQKQRMPGKPSMGKQVWSLETDLDTEWAHAIAPYANILLVEAPSSQLSDMLTAVDWAVTNGGATVVSMSWGGCEFPTEAANDNHFVHNNVTFVASSGDAGASNPKCSSGMGTRYPAVSPYVTAVGGTTLNLDSQGNYVGEVAWSSSSGGISAFESEPDYQYNFGIPNNLLHYRGNPDVAYLADFTNGAGGFAVYTTALNYGWVSIGGTSAGAPQWAALIAIANSLRAAKRKSLLTGANTGLYNAARSSYSADYHDVTSGSNGTCGTLCTSALGYDYVTGLGSPQAGNLVKALVNAK